MNHDYGYVYDIDDLQEEIIKNNPGCKQVRSNGQTKDIIIGSNYIDFLKPFEFKLVNVDMAKILADFSHINITNWIKKRNHP